MVEGVVVGSVKAYEGDGGEGACEGFEGGEEGGVGEVYGVVGYVFVVVADGG